MFAGLSNALNDEYRTEHLQAANGKINVINKQGTSLIIWEREGRVCRVHNGPCVPAIDDANTESCSHGEPDARAALAHAVERWSPRLVSHDRSVVNTVQYETKRAQ